MAIKNTKIIGTKIICEIESSNLIQTEYDSETKKLITVFKNGFKYFYVDSHAIEGGKPIEVFSEGGEEAEVEIATFARTGLSTYRPYRIKDKDITVYGRNSMVSHQVWSADYGYPGDPDYREFHQQDQRSHL